jgi:hypothetical protein
MGSVAERVVRTCRCPVLTVHLLDQARLQRQAELKEERV